MSNKPLRIALISVPAAGEPADRVVALAAVAKALAAAGHQVDVLLRRVDAIPPALAAPHTGMRVLQIDAGPPHEMRHHLLMPHMPAFADVVQRQMRACSPYDVLHAHCARSGWVGLALRLALGVPLVTSFHALGLWQREARVGADAAVPGRRGMAHSLAQRSNGVVAECTTDHAHLVRLYGASPERVVTVPRGVDVLAFRPGDRAAARQRLGLAANAFLVLRPGPVGVGKGVDTMIRAMALLKQAQLCVLSNTAAGAAAETPSLRDLSQTQGVSQRVQFVDPSQLQPGQVRDWYLACDVVVTPTWGEGVLTSSLQAMACARPVIGGMVGSIRDDVVDGLTGFLVAPNDPRALAELLSFMQANPETCSGLGRAGAHHVRRHCTWDEAARRLGQVYAGLLHAHEPPQHEPRPKLGWAPFLARPARPAPVAMSM